MAIAELKEQDINARVMAPREFERLVENIRERGALESLPYCSQNGGTGPVEIVSGHHRVRAGRAAGLNNIYVLVDTSEMTRSRIIAKQLAHNFLAGEDDKDILKQLLETIDTPDDLLASGAPDELLPSAEHDAMELFMPRIDFDFRTVTFSFLPHQQADLEKLIEMTDGRQDLMVACPTEQFQELLTVASRFARIRKVLSGGTAVALMVRAALEEIEDAEIQEQAEKA